MFQNPWAVPEQPAQDPRAVLRAASSGKCLGGGGTDG